MQDRTAEFPTGPAIRRVDGEFGLKLLGGGIQLRKAEIGIAEFVMRARALRRHFDGFLQFHDRAIVVVHGLHHFRGELMREDGIGIDGVHLRQRLLGQLHVDFGEQIPGLLIFGLAGGELPQMHGGRFVITKLRSDL